jgi:Arc/MetJ-type ribon-helix-helix transcriptional regulator
MQISLSKPDLVQFLEDQITKGHFHSPEAVIEAALTLLQDKSAPEGLEAKTLDSVRTSKAQFGRGEGRELRSALSELRRKYESQ